MDIKTTKRQPTIPKTTSLWGEMPDVKKVVLPLAILEEQAHQLSDATGGKLRADVSGDRLDYKLSIRADALPDFYQPVAHVRCQVGWYPALVSGYGDGAEPITAKDEQELRQALSTVFQSGHCREGIAGILAHLAAEEV